MSEIRSFKTAPPVGSDVPYKFIVYGDMGMSAAAHATAKYALRDVLDGYKFIVHLGDLSYARGKVRILVKLCTLSLRAELKTRNVQQVSIHAR